MAFFEITSVSLCGIYSDGHWKQSPYPSGSLRYSCFIPYGATFGGSQSTPFDLRYPYVASGSGQPK